MSVATLPQFLTMSQVCERLGVSRFALWEWRRKKLFPPPIVLGTRTLRWPEAVVTKFVEARTAKER